MTTEHEPIERDDEPGQTPQGGRVVVNLSPWQAIIAGSAALVVLVVLGFLLSGIVLIVLAVGLVLWCVGLVLRLLGLVGRGHRLDSEQQVTIVPPSTPPESIDQGKAKTAADLQADLRRRLAEAGQNTQE